MSNGIDEFKPTSDCLVGIFEYKKGHTGFKIPTYQRPYNWAEQHLCRLVEDIIENINNLIPGNMQDNREVKSYTFLGAIIIANDDKIEDDFEGNSYLVIDGQQRLITLSLLACSLIEWLHQNEKELLTAADEKLSDLQKKNFIKKLTKQCSTKARNLLTSFCLGQMTEVGYSIYFPKIIRSGIDFRGKTALDTEYRSDIAKLLDGFKEYVLANAAGHFSVPFDTQGSGADEDRIRQNLESFKEIIKNLSTDDYKGEESIEPKILNQYKHFTNKNIKSILDLRSLENEYVSFVEERDKHNKEKFCENYFFPFLKIYLFASYLAKNVVMTLVECPDEHYALSIFEKINTSGEPLTALETFKPNIVNLNENKNMDKGIINKIQEIFSDVESYVDDYSAHKDSDESLASRKSVSTEIILAFSQYYKRKEASKSLTAQRNIMKQFIKEDDTGKLDFVTKLNDICVYREKFWDSKDLSVISLDHRARVYFLYLQNMNKTLTIPLLARLFANNEYDPNNSTFLQHAKSLVAFTILWRAFAGETGGINKVYYSLLGKKDEIFRQEMHERLLEKIANKDETILRETWIKKVISTDLYNKNAPTAKFILLCAEDAKNREKIRPDMQRKDFLDDSIWTSNLYETIEHIAPQKPKPNDKAGRNILADLLTNTIGNLILLPRRVNSGAKNFIWNEKRELYRALSEKNIEKVKQQCEEIGVKFSKTLDGIENYPTLPIIKDLAEKEEWNSDEVKKRSEEILGYAWDELFSWLKCDNN